MAAHGACGNWWTGMRTEHCPACHETFSGRGPADKHRVGDHDVRTGPRRRRCLTPDEMSKAGLVLDSRGIWSTTEWRPREAPGARTRKRVPAVPGSSTGTGP